MGSSLLTFAFLLCASIAASLASTTLPPPPPRQGTTAVVARTIAAVETMMRMYNDETGRWQTIEPLYLPSNSPWWQSGNALQSLLDFIVLVPSFNKQVYLDKAYNTIELQRKPLPWYPQGGGEFRASSTDDTGWWTLALCRLYDLTGNSTFLDIAEIGEAFMWSYWDDVCGGGIWWNVKTLSYKNAISILLLMKTSVSLHNRIPNDTLYLQHAVEAWNWFHQSGMINSQYLINDGLANATCLNNDGPTWTYNQGVALGALSELYLATNETSYIATARDIANAVLDSPDLTPNGILTEPCESNGCNRDGASFKGIFVRNLAELNVLLDGLPYSTWLQRQASSMYIHARNASNHYEVTWSSLENEGRTFANDTVSISTQDSAVSLLTATISSVDNYIDSNASSIFLPFPIIRFTPWLLLEERVREIAATVLFYNESTWNHPGTADIETKNRLESLSDAQQNTIAGVLEMDRDMWNCYSNHYTSYSWTELASQHVQEYWSILGWTESEWKHNRKEDVFRNKTWDDLTALEKGAAHDVCYSQYTWGKTGVSLEEWVQPETTAVPTATDSSFTTRTPTDAPTSTMAPVAPPSQSLNAMPASVMATSDGSPASIVDSSFAQASHASMSQSLQSYWILTIYCAGIFMLI